MSMMRNRFAFALALAAISLAAAPPEARAKSAMQVEILYNVDVASLTLLKASYASVITETEFHSQATVKTKGLTTPFSEFNVEGEAAGVTDGKTFASSYFETHRQKGSKVKVTRVTRSADGKLSLLQHNGKPTAEEAAVAAALTVETLDPIAAVLRVGALNAEKPCRATQRVFDDKDVFDLEFSLKAAAASDTAPAMFQGQADHCLVTWRPVAGPSASVSVTSYDVWFGLVGMGARGPVWLPIKVAGKIKGLNFEAYATGIKFDRLQ
jgi:hypothetical protein